MVSSDGDKVSEEEKDRLLPAATGLGLPAVGDITIFTTDQQAFLSSNKTSKKRQKKQRSSHFSSSLPNLSSCSDPPPVVKRIQHRKHAPPQVVEMDKRAKLDEDNISLLLFEINNLIPHHPRHRHRHRHRRLARQKEGSSSSCPSKAPIASDLASHPNKIL